MHAFRHAGVVKVSTTDDNALQPSVEQTQLTKPSSLATRHRNITHKAPLARPFKPVVSGVGRKEAYVKGNRRGARTKFIGESISEL